MRSQRAFGRRHGGLFGKTFRRRHKLPLFANGSRRRGAGRLAAVL
jgi:hypothetical protein